MIKSILIIILLLCLPVYSTTYYVAKTGHDTDAGTSWATAWLTVNKTNTTMSAGDTCYFGTGVWRERNTCPTGGANSNIYAVGGSFSDRTCYAGSSFVKGIAHIYCSESLTGWTQHSGNVYKMTYSGAFGTTGDPRCYQGDSIFWFQGSIPTAVGQSYRLGDTIWVYAYDIGSGYDPDSYDMELVTNASACVALPPAADYVTINSLTLKYADRCIRSYEEDGAGADNPDSVFILNCHIENAYGVAGGNAACIYVGYAGGLVAADTVNNADWWEIKACSIGTGIPGSSGHGSAICIYAASNCYIESCYFYGYHTGDGIMFKNKYYGTWAKHNVIRYNTIVMRYARAAITIWNHPVNDSIYGNVIDGGAGGVISNGIHFNSNIEYAVGSGQDIYVFNNTIYNCTRGINASREDVDANWITKYRNVKYNAVYNNCSSSNNDLMIGSSLVGADTTWGIVDSNMYYSTNGSRLDSVFRVGTDPYGYLSLNEWRAEGHDSNSVMTDPAFNDAGNGDFSRPNASGEMNQTYGGRTWTIYGATQPDTSISQSLTCIDTTTTTLQIIDDFTLSNAVIDSVIFECSDDNWSSRTADTIGSPTDPDTSTLSGLTQNTEYKVRCRAWDSSAGVTDTSSELTITTDAAATSGKRLRMRK